MTTEEKHPSQTFEYARSKVASGEWSWEQAFEYAAKDEAKSGGWNWGPALDWCKQACDDILKK